ncbi:hypothetical protein HYH03_003218 [Edaphochlamys debaryana]|uniref:Dof-type domain-containing protein n=1 Tax=Edaphochlamys debaryana TaxID=47281 RepID=A0A836C4L6_9CHLO|nr:hypothetical protein HYH03_003218 [Edaphochlamys debaryana]|eukprot:KAG2499033.1 hypothetical protein HYH03_003218 [Edaphochlamys debaryana]
MDGGTREATSSSRGGLEDWEAGVQEDFCLEIQEGSHRAGVPRPGRGGNGEAAVFSKKRQERESSPEEDEKQRGKDAQGRPKLPRPTTKDPCPRCSSEDTKFCYYNNYNIKQPRFYCKTCQRYWTAGGTLRNIAPGSGRRKSKSKAARGEAKNSSGLPDHLTPAPPSSVFGLTSHGATSLPYPALLAASDPTAALLSNGVGAYTTHPQLLGGSSGVSGFKLASMSGNWGGAGGLTPDLREQLQAQLNGAGGGSGISGIDARLLLNAGSGDDLPLSLAQLQALQQASDARQRGQPSRSPSASPPPLQAHQHQQQHSSPQAHGSQLSQQPSPPQPHGNGCGSASDDADGGIGLGLGGDTDVCVQGKRVRVKGEIKADGTLSSLGAGSGMGSLTMPPGMAALSSSQLAGLTLPPSMASLAAVMGPGGSASQLSTLHPLLLQPEGAAGGLLDAAGPAATQITRQQLQQVLQQQHQQVQAAQLQQMLQAQHQAAQQRGASLQQLNQLNQLNDLLQPAGMAAVPSLLGGMEAAGLDSLQRSALLQQAGLLGGVSWQGPVASNMGSGNMASALEALQVQPLQNGGGSGAATSTGMLQAQPAAPSSCGVAAAAGSAGADWLSLAAIMGAGGKGAPGGPTAAQLLQAGAGSATVMPPAYYTSLWTAHAAPASAGYAGYALQAAAAAAAYSSGR